MHKHGEKNTCEARVLRSPREVEALGVRPPPPDDLPEEVVLFSFNVFTILSKDLEQETMFYLI